MQFPCYIAHRQAALALQRHWPFRKPPQGLGDGFPAPAGQDPVAVGGDAQRHGPKGRDHVL
jgi:hypothetical protein